jgi:hypothetical protein
MRKKPMRKRTRRIEDEQKKEAKLIKDHGVN